MSDDHARLDFGQRREVSAEFPPSPTPSHMAGLSETEAQGRLAEFGPNELPRSRRRTLAAILLETLREPMFALLIAAATLYLFLGEFGEGLFLVAAACASVGLVIFQEARSERALAALRSLAQPQARVIRAGKDHLIPARDLVPGDLILVGEGDRIPADALNLAGDVLSVDESALTGESAPVTKRVAHAGEQFSDDAVATADVTAFLLSGTLIVSGQATAEVCRTGAQSALGRIGASLATIDQTATPLQKAAGQLVAILGLFALIFCALVALTYGLLRSDWIGGALAGITVAIALIPEEFPMVLAIFLALGAWRLARRQVLVRRSAIIETLGAASALCIDKTGTLTRNHMQVARLWTPAGCIDIDAEHSPPPHAQSILLIAALACAERALDPMDRAIKAVAAPLSDRVADRTWPLQANRMAVVRSWPTPTQEYVLAAKGAPEAIFALCRLNQAQIAHAQTIVESFAEHGLRVLGVARAWTRAPLTEDPAEAHFEFDGLIGFLDPIRPEAPQALGEARAAGVKVMMITGDHPATARAIARAAGIDTEPGVLLGSDIITLPFPTLRERIKTVRVFARIAPDQKLLIIEALKANGEIVAMTGDGVNDAPALEAAHIGIAMGQRGTDVAREAADLILLDDGFASIIGGVRLGRRIFANLRKALTYVTAIHVPIAGLALVPILLGMPPLLYPMHVVLLELAIDPTCALAFEGEPSNEAAMLRPPRPVSEPLFGAAQIGVALLQGLVVFLGALGVYVWASSVAPEAEARGAAFLTLIGANMMLALVDAMGGDGRAFAPHRKTYWAIVAALAVAIVLIFAVPRLAQVFRIAPADWNVLGVSLLAAIVSGGWYWAALQVRKTAPSRAKAQDAHA